MNFVLESRVNLTGTPFDIGFQFAIGGFNREWINSGSLYYNMTSTVTYFDYNFRKWKNVHLFGGVGIGAAFVDVRSTLDDNKFTLHDRSFVFDPRVGVELFNHLRVTLNYKLMKSDYSYFGITIGCAFGGGYKQQYIFKM